MLLLCVIVIGILVATSSGAQTRSLTGTWQGGGHSTSSGPWVFNLQEHGDTVTAQIWARGGKLGPVVAHVGTVSGNTVVLQYRVTTENTPTIPVSGAMPNSPNTFRDSIVAPGRAGPTEFRLTGTVNAKGDEITFIGQSDRQVTVVRSKDGGIFDANLPERFTIKRSETAVSGWTRVEDGLPCPVFKLTFVNAKGKAFTPVRIETGYPVGVTQPSLKNFLVRLPAGAYRPVISDLPGGFTLKSIQINAQNYAGAPFTIPVDGAVFDVGISLGLASRRAAEAGPQRSS
jgi:hypothetical protein